MGSQFNSPPGWPTPPSGWTPPPGWKPDPTWPPAPAGWTFWITEPEPPVAQIAGHGWFRRHKVMTGIGLLLVLLIVASAVSHPKTTNASKERASASAATVVPSSSAPPSAVATTTSTTSLPAKSAPRTSAPKATPTPRATPTPTSLSTAALPPSPTAVQTFTASSSPTIRASTAAPAPKPAPTQAALKPTPTLAPAAAQLCGAPANPYGYNFCGRGGVITAPNPGVCSYFNCIASFWKGRGYMTECNDGTYSMSGGISGACSSHRGEAREVDAG
jgi:hypothetical protein